MRLIITKYISHSNISLSLVVICLVEEKKRVEPLKKGEVNTKSQGGVVPSSIGQFT